VSARGLQRGVTLVELIAVLTIVAVVASIGAGLMTRPIATLVSGSALAQLSDQASQATRRLEDDLGRALANSVRVTAGTSGGTSATLLEFVPVQTVGRYRKRPSATGAAGDPLEFEGPVDSSFDVLGPLDPFVPGSWLVVHNLGTAEADVYAGNNRRAGASLSGGSMTFTAGAAAFPVDSPSGRFAIVGAPVTWVCRPAADGSGTLERLTGYGFQATQPTDAGGGALAGASRIVVARGVAGCAIASEGTQGNLGIVRVALSLASGDAVARAAQQYALDNTP
jgi:MSHA biogenesis protein MshO